MILMEPREKLTASLPKTRCEPTLRQAVDEIAHKLRRKPSEIVRHAVEQYVAEVKQELAGKMD